MVMGLLNKLKRRTNSSKYYLSLDIGTEVVKVLVFYIDEKTKKGVIIGAARTDQKPGNMQSGAISDISGVIATCHDAIMKAEKEAGVGNLSQVVMGIAGELVKGTTTTVHYERSEPEARIDLPELKNIIQKVQWKAYERIREQIAWELGKNVDVRLINAVIVDVRIDGYRITNPLNFQGKELGISIFNAYAPMLHLGAINTIAEELNLELISVAAEPYAVSSSVGYEDIHDFSGIFIDIGGGTTDVAVVRNGGLEGTKMFAIGGRAFTKRLAYELHISLTEAETIKKQYATGNLDTETATRVGKVIAQDALVWLGGVELSLAEFAENDLLPSQIYLCGGGSALPELQKALLNQEWIRNLPFAKPPEISFLQPRNVVKMVDKTQNLRSPQDVTPMALASLVVSSLDEERVLAKILSRAMRTIQDY